MTVEEYHAFARTACESISAERAIDVQAWECFKSLLHYVQMDATDGGEKWRELKNQFDNDLPITILYLAVSPSLYVPIVERLGEAGVNTSKSRLVLEKPIGTDLSSARAINDGVADHFDEEQIYRIDHYLGKETVQNLMVLRFANGLLEPSWSRSSIDNVQITVAEKLGVEGRASYYDGSGALRDMVQNHLLQLLCLTAMEPPASLNDKDVRTEKIKVLQSLRRLDKDSATRFTVRGQYNEGIIDGSAVRSYIEELPQTESNTETFVALKVEIDNWRWAGVPFYLRTGKRMGSQRSEIVITFKPVPHSIFEGGEAVEVNRLVLRLQPDEAVRLYIQIKEPGPGGLRIKSLPLNLSYAENFSVRYPDAYERLLMDVIRGNLSLFMRRDEVEAAWSWVDDIISAWDELDTPPALYSAGTDGPVSAAMLLDRDGKEWWIS